MIVEEHEDNNEINYIVAPLVHFHFEFTQEAVGYELPSIISDLSLDNDESFHDMLIEKMLFHNITGYNISLDQ